MNRLLQNFPRIRWAALFLSGALFLSWIADNARLVPLFVWLASLHAGLKVVCEWLVVFDPDDPKFHARHRDVLPSFWRRVW